MTNKQKWMAALAALVVAVGTAAFMVARHSADSQGTTASRAEVVNSYPQMSDGEIVLALQKASVPLDGLSVHSVGGIVVLRGSAGQTAAARVVAAIKSLGFKRVANLIQTAGAYDDEGIRRDAERQLARMRSLDGCTLKVSCDKGVLLVTGTVQSELQQDAARNVLRSVHGAQQVRVELSKVD